MASLLTSAEKTVISDVFDDLHDTFSRTIRIFVKSPKVQSATNYNGYYERNNSLAKTQTSDELTAVEKSARIKYLKQDEKDANFGAQVGLESSYGDVRLKVNEDTAGWIKKSVYVEVDGELFENPTDSQAVGPFSIDYFTFYLRRKN